MKKLLSKNYKDYKTSPNLKNNLIIDNTKLSSVKVSDMIIEHFNLNENKN